MARFDVDRMRKELLPDGQPPNLYKFNKVDEYLHESLKGGYLWHSGRRSFNDPYDCYKHLLTFEPTAAQLIDYARRTLLPGESLDEVTNFILKNPKLVPETFVQQIDSILDSYGICCFTINYQNTLMWSHYAQNHKGICLVFDTTKHPESFLVVKVRYTDDFVPRNYFDDYDNAAMIMLTTKSEDWKYEQEYRLVDKSQGAIAFCKEALVGIIFGCGVTQDNMLSIINTVETSEYKNVEYLQACTLPNSFKLGFRQHPWLSMDSTVFNKFKA